MKNFRQLLFATLFIATLLLPQTASAAESYALEGFACRGYSGQTDERGVLYVPCNGVIRMYDKDGRHFQTITQGAVDVAPAADGSFIYIQTGWGQVPRRMVRGADNAYRLDAWVPQNFFYGGAYRAPQASHIATDAFNNLYIASGYWTGNLLHTVIKYTPDGRPVTTMGQYTNGGAVNDPRHWDFGYFYWGIAGITVSRNGRHVYVSEVGNNRVQRFDYQLDGSFRVGKVFGNTAATDPNRKGSCAPGLMAAPYDLGIDMWGYVYVANATCSQVQKFTADGQHVYSMYTGSNGPNAPGVGVNHYIAVTARGDVLSTETSRIMRRTSALPGPWPVPQPLPAPDNQAPDLKGIAVPATVNTRQVDITVTATDNQRVYQVRIANEDGTWSAWKAFANPVRHTLTAGYGTKAVSVQVRDEAENESNVRSTTLDYRSTDTAAPTVNAVTLPAETTTRTITVAINAADDTAVTEARFANEDGNWTAWRAFAANMQHELTAGYAVKGVTVQVRDAAGNESPTVFRTTRYAAAVQEPQPQEPQPGGDIADPVIVNAALPATTTTTAVTVAIEATDDVGVTQVRFANEDGVWLAWKAFAAESAHTLTPLHGPKAVFVQVRDAAGRTSATRLLRTRYEQDAGLPPGGGGAGDATAPTLNALTLPAVTSTQDVTVRIDATDNVAVAQVRFANEDGTWGPWRAFAAESTHTLSANYGPKAVFAQVRDAAGNESATRLSRTSYEQNAPAGAQPAPADDADPTLTSVTTPATTATRIVRLVIDATDNVGVAQIRFANEDGNWQAWKAFTPQMDHQLTAGNGAKAVFVQVRDAAGRESNVVLVRTTLG